MQIIDWNSLRCSFLKHSSSYSLVQITNTDEGCCRAEQVRARESRRGHLQRFEISHAWSSGGSFCQAWGHGKKCDLSICIFIIYSTQISPWCNWNYRSQGFFFYVTCIGPGCSQPSTSIAGCFGVESYCRHEGLTPARTDAGNVAALGNGDEIPICSCHVSAAGDSNRDQIYCNCSVVVTLT